MEKLNYFSENRGSLIRFLTYCLFHNTSEGPEKKKKEVNCMKTITAKYGWMLV